MDNDQLLAAIKSIVQEEVKPVKESVGTLQEELHESVGALREEVTSIRQSVVKLEAMPKQIQLLAEAQKGTNERIDKLQASVDEMAPTVTALDILHRIQKETSNPK